MFLMKYCLKNIINEMTMDHKRTKKSLISPLFGADLQGWILQQAILAKIKKRFYLILWLYVVTALLAHLLTKQIMLPV